MQEFTMALQSRVHILLADLNAQRARAGLKPISGRQVAREIGVSSASLNRFMNGDDHVTLTMLDKLMQFFRLDDMNELLAYTEEK